MTSYHGTKQQVQQFIMPMSSHQSQRGAIVSTPILIHYQLLQEIAPTQIGSTPTSIHHQLLQEIMPTTAKQLYSATAFALPSWQVGCSVELLIHESKSILAYLEAQAEAHKSSAHVL
jgi:hypothetical protein